MAVYADHRGQPVTEPIDIEEEAANFGMPELPDLSSLIASLGGQEGISATINNLLGNSDMGGGSTPGSSSGSYRDQESGGMPDLASLMAGVNPGMLSGLLGNSGPRPNSPCSRLCALTSALAPFLSPSRRGRADKVLQILRILGAAEQPVLDDDRLPLIIILVYLFF